MPIFRLVLRLVDKPYTAGRELTEMGRRRIHARPRRGDIIDILRPDYEPSDAVKNNPNWSLIEVDFDSEAEAVEWIKPEIGDDFTNKYLNTKNKTIDIDAMPSGLKKRIESNSTRGVRMTKAQLLAVTKTKPAGRDPEEIPRGN